MRFYCDKLVLSGVSLVLHIIKEGTLNPWREVKAPIIKLQCMVQFFPITTPPSPPPRYNPRGCNLFVLHGGIFFSPGRAQGIW